MRKNILKQKKNTKLRLRCGRKTNIWKILERFFTNWAIIKELYHT